MLDIKKKQEGSRLEFALEGRLDTSTAPQLEEEVKASIDDITELVFDFSELEYMTSAGIRELLIADNMLGDGGYMKVIHANEMVREVFELTGLDELLENE